MKTALLIVDVQNDFCPGGALGTDGGDEVAQKIAGILRDGPAAHGYSHFLATQDWHIDPGTHFAPEGEEPDFVTSWPRHCVADTEGAALREPIDPADIDALFRKGQYDDGYSGFDGTTDDGQNLANYLHANKIDALDVCGIATDFCVRATVLSARGEGFSVRVLRDLCSAVHPAGAEEALAEMEEAGATLA